MNGGKDIKIGDDKRPIPVIPSNEQFLYNIANGELLTDEFGNPLITEVDTFYQPGASSKKSTSVVFSKESGTTTKYNYVSIATTTATYSSARINNIGITTSGLSVGDLIVGGNIPDGTIISRIGIGSIFISNLSLNTASSSELVVIKRKTPVVVESNPVWKVAEQFKETSEVSSTLLGINRAETQLSLFSNVSSYGLDPDDFDFYEFNEGFYFLSWERRKNSIYGDRYLAKASEETQESAIKIEAFPAPYSFPYGPKFEKLGVYNQTLFPQYLNFVDLGNQLHDYFNTGAGSSYPLDWKNKFLPSFAVTLSGSGPSADVEYLLPVDESFAYIDTWTDTWRDIKDSILVDPITNEIFNFGKVKEILGSSLDSTNTRPGYTDRDLRYGYLQSRRVFRYQPGRISGFTFGLRSSVEKQPGIILEWGISNPTDQYVFRINSGQFSILRRSTIPLEKSVLERNGLTLDDQKRIESGDPFDDTEYWTIDIPRDKFNGDPLNSNGPSGYLLKPENVTMYKIEFGWYGAIGARFYVYIPTDNGDARWVVIHTLVLENSLGVPCLRDSYFRFKYSLAISNTSNIRTPQFLYKYGASYYIDGGDEGSSQSFSSSSGQKIINKTDERTLLAVLPKDNLLNKDGVEIKNKKLIIPTKLNVSSDSLSEVKIVTCKACPGFGHVYTPGLATTESGRYINLEFSDSDTIEILDDYFTEDDIGSKLIAPSIYNAYIVGLGGTTEIDGITKYSTAKIEGFEKVDTFKLGKRDVGGSLVFDRVTGISTVIGIGVSYPHPVRLSQYNSYAASDYAFTGSKIEIQFVNPNSKDTYTQFCDYLIGVTDKKPDVSDPDTLNGFVVGSSTTSVLPNSDILFGEHTLGYTRINENAVEVSESIVNELRMEIDYRIPDLPSPSPGTCSKITVQVLDPLKIQNVNQVNYDPEGGSTTPDPQGRSWITLKGNFPSFEYDKGEIRYSLLNDPNNVQSSGVFFVGEPKTFTDNQNELISYIQISGTIGNVGSDFNLWLRPVNVFGQDTNKTKIFTYDVFPLYLVAKLRDNAEINNISVKETIGNIQKTISPKWYVSENTDVTDAEGRAKLTGDNPTNFKDVYRSSSALVDSNNYQSLRPYTQRDTLYIGENETKSFDMDKIFGIDRNVITPDNNNLEAIFVIAKKIDVGDSGTIEASLNYKEQ